MGVSCLLVGVYLMSGITLRRLFNHFGVRRAVLDYYEYRVVSGYRAEYLLYSAVVDVVRQAAGIARRVFITPMLPEKLIAMKPDVSSISAARLGLATRLYIVSLGST